MQFVFQADVGDVTYQWAGHVVHDGSEVAVTGGQKWDGRWRYFPMVTIRPVGEQTAEEAFRGFCSRFVKMAGDYEAHRRGLA